MNRQPQLAALGASPVFKTALHVAQINMPPWDKVEAAFRGIFKRRFYANHGPLVNELDYKFAQLTGAKHAICMTNGTVALMALAKGLDLSGEVIVPAFTFPATVQSLVWAGLKPVFCDVDLQTHMISAKLVEPLINYQTSAVLGVHLWGRACDPENLEVLCNKRRLKLFFDACHGIGCQHGQKTFGNFGSGEAFSLHATKILNAAEGGCVTTNDTELASKLKTIRSFHAGETIAPDRLRMNAKMSEAQAAFALLSIEDLSDNIKNNKMRYQEYKRGLSGLPGLSIVQYSDQNNYQYVVVEIDEKAFGLSRDALCLALRAENILCRRHFYPGLHHISPFSKKQHSLPITDQLCETILQLPCGDALTKETVNRVCDTVVRIWENRRHLLHLRF